jgi:flavin prenyltransferase
MIQAGQGENRHRHFRRQRFTLWSAAAGAAARSRKCGTAPGLDEVGRKDSVSGNRKHITEIRALADHSYSPEDISARLASGSYPVDAMVIAPCSIHTMSAIAHGITSNLLTRAADVTLKERRKLILMVRETPFHLGHLRSMTALAEMGAIIAPPIPGFYHHPQTVMDLVDHSLDRVLDLLGLPDAAIRRWQGAGQ